jgi:hypothetical protein
VQLNSIKGEKGELYWKRFCKLDFMQILSSIRIDLNHFATEVIVMESFERHFKIGKVSLSMLDTEFAVL